MPTQTSNWATTLLVSVITAVAVALIAEWRRSRRGREQNARSATSLADTLNKRLMERDELMRAEMREEITRLREALATVVEELGRATARIHRLVHQLETLGVIPINGPPGQEP